MDSVMRLPRFHTGNKRWAALLCGLICLGFAPARAQVSPSIPLADPVYQDLRRLEAAGLLDSLIIASRPLTYLDAARLLAQAETKYRLARPTGDHPVILRLKSYYGLSGDSTSRDGWRGRWGALRLRTAEVRYLGMREPSRSVPQTNALTTPFLREREGRRFAQGHNLDLEIGGDWQPASWAVVAGRGRWQNHLDNLDGGHLQLMSLYAKVQLLGPLVLQFGRDSVSWGYNRSGSLGIGQNAKPFDMVKLSTSRHISGPWILRYLGPMQPVIFLTHMGNNRQDFKRPFLLSARLDMAPHRSVRIGLYRWMQFNGEGARSSSIGEILGDFFGVRPGKKSQNPTTDPIFTRHINNGAGLEAQWRLPMPGDVTLFGEVFWEDAFRVEAFGGKLSFIPKPFWSFATSRSIGLSAWSILDQERLGINAEYVEMSKFAYRHGQYSSGFTYERALIGHDLGPKGFGGYFQIISRINPKLSGALGVDIEKLGADEAQPEFRVRLVPHAEWNFRPKTQLLIRGGYEWARDFNFVPGVNQQNMLFEVKLRFYY